MAANYTLSRILPLVREALKVPSNFTFDQFADATWRVLETAGVPGVERFPAVQIGLSTHIYNYEQAPYDLRFAFTEAFQYLIRNGYIIPGVNTHVRGFPESGKFYRTPSGEAWATETEPMPEDVEGYMGLLWRLVPNLDGVIEQYVKEGLRSYERGNIFAAAVMLGAASEKAIYLLAESMRKVFKVPRQTATLEKLINGRGLNKLFEFIQITVANASAIIPYGVSQGASAHLMSIIEAIRVQRNDAVHPQGAKVSVNKVRFSYQAFVHALEMLERLRDWFSKNPGAI